MLKPLTILGAACTLALSVPVFAAGAADAEKALADAKTAKAEAASAGGEWRDTGDMLEQAEKAMADKKYDEAVDLAGEAKFQYEAGKEQMGPQTHTGNPGYL